MGLLPLIERFGKAALNRLDIQSRWVETATATLHLYDARGTGRLPTVVLLHGIGASAVEYGPLIPFLRRRVRRVIAPELPAHGFSASPRAPLTPDSLFAATAEMLDRVLDEPAVIFGNSLGGAVALHYAIRAKGRVGGLVLGSPAGASMGTEEMQTLLEILRMRTRAEASAFLARLYHRPPWFSPLVAGDLVDVFAREALRSLTRSVRLDQAFTPEELGALTVPVTVIWGRSDRLLPRSSLEYLRTHLPPHARIDEPERVGHCPQVDAPVRVTNHILAVAKQASQARSGASAGRGARAADSAG